MRAIGTVLCLVFSLVASAQDWPKPIRWVVPYPPGGGTEPN